MLRVFFAAAALALIAAPSLGAPCKDANGRFMKCPPAAMHNVVRGKDGRCRVANGANKGKFAKC